MYSSRAISILLSLLPVASLGQPINADDCDTPSNDTSPVTPPAAAVSATIKCPIVLDGRVPAGTSLSFFDTSNDLFSADYVKGNNLTWSQILKSPAVPASRFDAGSYQAVEVTISDESIFNTQYGFRRAGLQFASDSANDTSDSGVMTMHFSVKQDASRPLNLSHEYLNVWHETADYAANQFNFEAGTLLDDPDVAADSFKIRGRTNNVVYEVPIDYSNWQNFAVTVDYTANTLQVYYSVGNATLTAVTEAVTNDNSGTGQFQMGILKKPTGTDDVVNSGFQQSPVDEGLIYGGMFVEDSAGGCVSL